MKNPQIVGDMYCVNEHVTDVPAYKLELTPELISAIDKMANAVNELDCYSIDCFDHNATFVEWEEEISDILSSEKYWRHSSATMVVTKNSVQWRTYPKHLGDGYQMIGKEIPIVELKSQKEIIDAMID